MTGPAAERPAATGSREPSRGAGRIVRGTQRQVDLQRHVSGRFGGDPQVTPAIAEELQQGREVHPGFFTR